MYKYFKMRNYIFPLLAVMISTVSCVEQEIATPEPEEQQNSLVFSIEKLNDTKVSLNDKNRMLWSEDDQVLVFDGQTKGCVYTIDDESVGMTSGEFVFYKEVKGQTASRTINHKVAYYPFNKSVFCDPAEADDEIYVLSGINLPDEQKYVSGSIDPLAFPMAAVGDMEDDELSFRNICGVLNLKLCGDCEVVSIKLTGNNSEKLSGSADVTLKGDYKKPEVRLSSYANSSVSLVCSKEKVLLNQDNPVDFMMVIPPTEFAKGFKVTVTDANFNEYVYETDERMSVERSSVLTIPAKLKGSEIVNPDADEMLTVLNKRYKYYEMLITVPESVKAAGNVIRWNRCCLMMYNHVNSSANDFTSLLFNASRWTDEDLIFSYYDEGNNDQTGPDLDGDGIPDYELQYNPIFPGEPVVFTAAEFTYVDESYAGGNKNIVDALKSWGSGFYQPLLDESWYDVCGENNATYFDGMTLRRPMDDAWQGAFQRKFFRVKEPSLLDGGVNVVLRNATSYNILLEFYPDYDVNQYVVLILDDEKYEHFMSLICDRDEYKQWAVTSYFTANTYFPLVLSENIAVNIEDVLYNIKPDSDYHVLITSMDDHTGQTQSFQEYTFRTSSRILPAPVVEVTPVGATASEVSFNVKCTSAKDGNPLKTAYYAANYVHEWERALKDGLSYTELDHIGGTFYSSELEYINSDDGYTITFPSLDGETTRLAVLGYNIENTPNDLDYPSDQILDCPAVAEQTAEWLSKKPKVDTGIFEKLKGKWTARAEIISKDNVRSYKTCTVTISDNACDYPSSLPSAVYSLYEGFGYTRSQIDDLWDEFRIFADIYTERRLVDQNRLLCIGWLGNDFSSRTPYDLFAAADYDICDVEAMFYDFGPKWYIEAVRDFQTGSVSLVIPFSFNNLPPAANWCGTFRMCGYDHDSYSFVSESDLLSIQFPVEYDEASDKITIKPIVYYGYNFYPNMIRLGEYGDVLIDDQVVSEIVLSRNIRVPLEAQTSTYRPSATTAAKTSSHYKARTRLEAQKEIPVVEYKMFTLEQVKANADKYVKKILNCE